jgi:hypothetical protein
MPEIEIITCPKCKQDYTRAEGHDCPCEPETINKDRKDNPPK